MMGARRGLTDKARRHFSKGLDDLALAIAMTQHSRISLTLAAPSWSGILRPEELTEFSFGQLGWRPRSTNVRFEGNNGHDADVT